MKGNRPFHNERGMFLLFVGLGIVGILGLAMLVVDLGYFYVSRNRIHIACDAAALAGASKLDGTSNTNQDPARTQAQSVAGQNTADGHSVVLAKNSANDLSGDIILGYWTTTGGFTTTSPFAAAPVSAVRVNVSFDGGPASDSHAANNQVQTFFARIFGHSSQTIAVRCTAAKVPPPVLPVAANEYWDEPDTDCSPSPPREYSNQGYPNSFLRLTNISGTGGCHDGSTATLFGKVFGIVGVNGGGVVAATQDKGWIDLFNRKGYFRDTTTAIGETGWYPVDQNGVVGSACTGACTPGAVVAQGGYQGASPAFVKEEPLVGSPWYGDPNSTNLSPPLAYNTPTVVPPAVTPGPQTCPSGTLIPSGLDAGYPCDNHVSDSPYATVSFPSGTIAVDINKTMAQDPAARYRPTTKAIVFVYDGVGRNPSTGLRRITLLGVAAIEICGYTSGSGKGALNQVATPPKYDTCNKSPDTGGNTMYGRGIIAMDDPTITSFQALLNKLTEVRLVE